ncbi:MAG: hypothetical protein TREMPRED_003108 [Tremellales sp. Tagirdzhanova-0007]|nr:MAG: hypothetical protein TREMPRED_003108 [Tremellales sp. Tagirdzhanova-0007]
MKRYSSGSHVPDSTLTSNGDASLAEDFMMDTEDVEESEMRGEIGVLVEQIQDRPRLPTSIKKLNKLLSRHVTIDIPEHELEEKFVRGRGPGGQAINKTSSSVCLTHLPTGIRVQAQPTRSREQNRAAARHILRDRLDHLRATGALPGASVLPVTNDHEGGKSAKKMEEVKLAAVYAKDELRAAKVMQRKANRAKKHRKKLRELEGTRENRDVDKEDEK